MIKDVFPVFIKYGLTTDKDIYKYCS